MEQKEKMIGVFDSGMGGISTLRALCREMPHERFYYFGDCANAPYGSRRESEILSLTRSAVEQLLRVGIKELVIACNTATSAAAAALRQELSIPVIGIEPAVKPAAELVRSGSMLVLATEATIRQDKLRLLVERYGKNTVMLPCPGFADTVEQGIPARDVVEKVLAPVRGMPVDVCVLGCTHYPFLRAEIDRMLPGVPILDGNEGTARQAARVLARDSLLRECGAGSVILSGSGSERDLARMRSLFETSLP